MKLNSITKALCAGCLFATGLGASANSLQRTDVAAEPAWVVHVDVDGLRPTSVGQYVLRELEKPEYQAKLTVFQNLFSVDLRSQLHGLTLYSTGEVPEDGVLLVYADFEPKKLETLAEAANEHQSTNHNQHVIHSWVDDKKRKDGREKSRTYAAIQANRLVIFGQREASVAAALDVLDHSSQNLVDSKNFPQLGSGGRHGFIDAAARKLDLPGSDVHAALFRLSRMMRLQVGETKQKVTATLSLDAKDEDVAGHMVSVGQGLVALLKLQKEKAEVVKLADALTLKQDGLSVVATLSVPADDLIQMMKAHSMKEEEKAAEKK